MGSKSEDREPTVDISDKKVKISKEEKKSKKQKEIDEGKVLKKEKKDKKEHKKENKNKKDKEHKKDKKSKTNKSDETGVISPKLNGRSDSLGELHTSKKRHAEPEQKETKSEKKAKLINSSHTDEDIKKFLTDNAITIEESVSSDTKPALTFDVLNDRLDPKILTFLKSQYKSPTPIQSAAWPFLLEGKDVVGVAETGSGKTMAFGVPAVHRLLNGNSKKKGVRACVISPTRELAMQIHDNLTSLSANVNLRSVCVYGGVSKDEQRLALKKASIVIATPGRLNDLLNEGSCDLSNVEYLVLDEADRMLEKGFEEDIKRIISHAPSKFERQTLMFTATWPQEVRDLASTFMRNDATVKISVGDRDELSANKRITQIVEVIDPFRKEQRLLQLLKEHQSGAKRDDKILVFALYKKEAARVERLLQNKGYHLSAIHGDLNQQQRTSALEDFKKGNTKILLATDVAARGLDIPAVKVVINLTFPLTAEDYVHRIGRTGRAGQTGLAVTLFTEQEKHLSGALINVLRGANQPVPDDLLKFGSHTKKKEHGAYGAFFKDVDSSKKATKIKFD